jgi:hypothetical protein
VQFVQFVQFVQAAESAAVVVNGVLAQGLFN